MSRLRRADEREKNQQDFWLKGKLIVIESVPTGVCPQCGEKIVKADVGRQLATLIQNLKRLPNRKTITVPVVRYAKEMAWFLKLAHFCSTCGPHFCSMKITQDVREYAAQKEIDEKAALGVGLKELAEEFIASRWGDL